ncbi:MAG: serine/threonine-protein kinase [Phycisphaerales bacterium]|nr:serine/threonine-protein kinase [Phycisphaerales bacterium]
MSVDIPNYRIIEKLGVGAQTRVYRARYMPTAKDYTVKVVKIVNPEDAGFIELLKAEYAIGSSIDHPVIRKVFELRMLRQRFRLRGAILFMEYVNGITLGEKEFQGPLDETLRIFSESAHGLYAMHLAGWVHADLKPTNIMVATDGAVKLIDLGQSARIHEPKAKIQGTVDYMAPEQVQRGTLDQRTDVFGLGATLHKVLTGKPIATQMNQTVNLQSFHPTVKRVEDMPASVMDGLPTCVLRLIDDCCRPDPAERIADMPTLIERIALARTIIAKKSADEDAPVTIVNDHAEDEDDWSEDDNLAAIVEGLGLSDDDEDEPIDIGDPETDVPPSRS